MKKTKEELKQIFNDTKRFVELRHRGGSTTKFDESSIKPISHYLDPVIRVESIDSVSAVRKYGRLGSACVLNMASAKTAGGGVADGFTAQEECLFRCSSLSVSVTQDLYPLDGNVALYSNDICFFKDVDYEYNDAVIADVVSVAAVNLNINSKYDEETDIFIDGMIPKPKDYDDTMLKRIRLMCCLAIDNDVEYLILGAWGCGVFKNNPHDISELFHTVLISEGYGYFFRKVIFAVINDHNSVANNYEIFKERFAVDKQ
jgi:uncharacterized protein (TIGR02452 family)